MTDSNKHYVYIVKCKDGTYYTGYTTDVNKRVETHNKGKGAKYTRGRRPVELVFCAVFDDKSNAMRFELEVKALSRSDKYKLVSLYAIERANLVLK